MDEWGPERAGELAALLQTALPSERLESGDVGRACWSEESSTVLGFSDGSGAVAVRSGRRQGQLAAAVLAVAVARGGRRCGQGRLLLEAACDWASSRGARLMTAGGLPPWYLWPGIDVAWTPALALFEAAGFQPSGAVLNLACGTDLGAPVPAGIEVQRVEAGSGLAAATAAMAERDFPDTTWPEEVERAIELGTTHVAVDGLSREVLGFACHSVNRQGWFGPTAVAEEARGRGVGTALLAASLADLRRRGHGTVEISWVGPIGFYAKVAGASVSRVFRTAVREL